jgi:hypothetical protein
LQTNLIELAAIALADEASLDVHTDFEQLASRTPELMSSPVLEVGPS